jgi:hypothetical protein
MKKIVSIKNILLCVIAGVSLSAVAADKKTVTFDRTMSSEDYCYCDIMINKQVATASDLNNLINANATVNITTKNILIGAPYDHDGNLSNISVTDLVSVFFAVRSDNKSGHIFGRAAEPPAVTFNFLGDASLACYKGQGTNRRVYGDSYFK